jgi:hypothetical protein
MDSIVDNTGFQLFLETAINQLLHFNIGKNIMTNEETKGNGQKESNDEAEYLAQIKRLELIGQPDSTIEVTPEDLFAIQNEMLKLKSSVPNFVFKQVLDGKDYYKDITDEMEDNEVNRRLMANIGIQILKDTHTEVEVFVKTCEIILSQLATHPCREAFEAQFKSRSDLDSALRRRVEIVAGYMYEHGGIIPDAIEAVIKLENIQ